MDSSLARSPSFHHVLLNSMWRFVCNPDRQMHTSSDILAAGHCLLRFYFILTQSESFFNCPARVKVITGLRLVAHKHPSLLQYHVSWLQKIYFGIIRVWWYKYYYDCKQLSIFKWNQLLQVHAFPDCWKPALSHWDNLDQTEAGGHGNTRRRWWGKVKMSCSLTQNNPNREWRTLVGLLIRHRCAWTFPVKGLKREGGVLDHCWSQSYSYTSKRCTHCVSDFFFFFLFCSACVLDFRIRCACFSHLAIQHARISLVLFGLGLVMAVTLILMTY